MAGKKGLHIFDVGDLVLPHPLITLVYEDTVVGDMGIVLKRYPPEHPTKDMRKVKVFWQQKMIEKTYYAHIIYHLHHDETVQSITDHWKLEIETARNRARPLRMGDSMSNREILCRMSKHIFDEKYPPHNTLIQENYK